MKFKKNDIVLIPKIGQVKKIVDSEIIENQEIYYMDDITSYHISDLFDLPLQDHLEELRKIIFRKQLRDIDKINEIFWTPEYQKYLDEEINRICNQVN